MIKTSDLIERKAVLDYLREQSNNVIIERHKGGFVSEDVCRGMESAINAFRNFILTLPEIKSDDPVPADILEEEHEDPAEYLARKYGIRGDADGDNKGTAPELPK